MRICIVYGDGLFPYTIGGGGAAGIAKTWPSGWPPRARGHPTDGSVKNGRRGANGGRSLPRVEVVTRGARGMALYGPGGRRRILTRAGVRGSACSGPACAGGRRYDRRAACASLISRCFSAPDAETRPQASRWRSTGSRFLETLVLGATTIGGLGGTRCSDHRAGRLLAAHVPQRAF